MEARLLDEGPVFSKVRTSLVAIPNYQSLMLPLLRMLNDGQIHRVSALVDRLAEQLGLSEVERAQLLPSGKRPLFDHRVWWARTDLVQAGVLESTARGTVHITELGRSLLAENPPALNRQVLTRYPEFVAFLQRSRKVEEPRALPSGTASLVIDSQITKLDLAETPEEVIGHAVGQLNESLAQELLARVQALPARFFETLVLDLLVAMGYGGTLQDAAQVMGKSGDAGIDGVIKEDKLGLDMIYIQAKRWEGTVGRPVVSEFAGSLQGQRATKGVLLTTGTFSSEARAFVDRIGTRIVLIDGAMLARLMIEHNVGVSVAFAYEVKRIDSVYFGDDET